MRTCPKCGCEIDDMADLCPGCVSKADGTIGVIEIAAEICRAYGHAPRGGFEELVDILSEQKNREARNLARNLAKVIRRTNDPVTADRLRRQLKDIGPV